MDKGVPYLTVLDSDGKVIKNQNTGVLENGSAHDPAAVLAFLKKWQPEPLDAQLVYKSALAKAEKENKVIFIRIGSPSCGWCRRFDEFVNRDEIAKILDQDYDLVKIDLARMKNGKEVDLEIRGTEQGGIPWFAFLSGKGEKLATSDSPSGNIGFPAQDEEIQYFKTMLTKTAKHITQEQIDKMAKTLQDYEQERLRNRQTAATSSGPH